jgi:hypothetical protein
MNADEFMEKRRGERSEPGTIPQPKAQALGNPRDLKLE